MSALTLEELAQLQKTALKAEKESHLDEEERSNGNKYNDIIAK